MTRQVDVKALISHIVRGDGADKCRICMGDTSEGQVYLGDTVMMDGDRSVTLSELLETITGVEVDVPALPESVCLSCMKHVSAAIPLIQLSWASSRKLREITDFLYNFELPKHRNKSNITKHLYLVFDEDGPKSYTDNTRCPTLPPTNKKSILRNFKNRLNRFRHFVKRRDLDYFKNKSKLYKAAKSKATISEQETLNVRIEEDNNTRGDNGNMRKCSNSKVTWNDGSTVCPECACCFFDCYTFIRHVRNLNLKPCHICKNIFPLHELAHHTLKKHDIEILSCDVCSETFHMHASLEYHMKKYHDQGLQLCLICKRSYPCLSQHSIIHRPRTCRGCNKSFTNFSCYKKHPCPSPVPNPSSFICHFCSKTFYTSSTLHNHIKYLHLRAKLIPCEVCKKPFANSRELLRHKRIKHEGAQVQYVCICGLKFFTKGSYKKHYNNVHLTKKYVCVECNAPFATENGLQRHMFLHTPETCSGCNKIFTNKHHFNKHCCSNPTLKTEILICDICSAEYSNKNALRIHIRTQHLIGKQFQCDKCGKKFSNRIALAEHDNTHEKVKDRYVCSICDQKYSTRRGYSGHFKRVHLGIIDTRPKKPRQKKYSCAICDFKSAYRYAIPRHINSKHKTVGNEKKNTK